LLSAVLFCLPKKERKKGSRERIQPVPGRQHRSARVHSGEGHLNIARHGLISISFLVNIIVVILNSRVTEICVISFFGMWASEKIALRKFIRVR
jgi:hypothetical protein